MNIFVLHHKPTIAARMMCDQHVTKMIVEQAQMLCFVHHLRNKRKKWVERNIPFKLNASHAKHPCTVWLMEDPRNYAWGYRLLRAMLKEYDYRYDGLKDGKYANVIQMLPALRRLPTMERVQDVEGEPEDFVLAVNKVPECITDCAVETYRRFYVADKSSFARWSRARPAPKWYVKALQQYKETQDITAVSIV